MTPANRTVPPTSAGPARPRRHGRARRRRPGRPAGVGRFAAARRGPLRLRRHRRPARHLHPRRVPGEAAGARLLAGVDRAGGVAARRGASPTHVGARPGRSRWPAGCSGAPLASSPPSPCWARSWPPGACPTSGRAAQPLASVRSSPSCPWSSTTAAGGRRRRRRAAARQAAPVVPRRPPTRCSGGTRSGTSRSATWAIRSAGRRSSSSTRAARRPTAAASPTPT